MSPTGQVVESGTEADEERAENKISDGRQRMTWWMGWMNGGGEVLGCQKNHNCNAAATGLGKQ